MIMSSAETTIPPSEAASVRRSILVAATQAHAFAVFTAGFGSWWPLESHHIGLQPARSAVIEPRVGGRWFEQGIDGSECRWGRVLVWEPPARLVLCWQLSAEFRYDPELHTEIEIRFIAEAERSTRVELEHRGLEAYGEAAQRMRSAFDSENGWAGILQNYAAAAGGT
jgi:uncharacterized protein YndB with AHSA1/START domain